MNSVSNASIGLIVGACFIIVIAGLKVASSIILPFILAVFIALLMKPMVNGLTQKGLPNGLSIVLALLLLLGFGFMVGSLVSNSVKQFIANSENYQIRLESVIDDTTAFFTRFGIDLSFGLVQEHLNPSAIFPLASNLLNAIGNVLADTFLILLFLVFILAEETGFSERLKIAFPGEQKRFDMINTVNSKIAKYMLIKALISLATGTSVFIGLLIIGVDFPLLWGFLAFLLNFIPNFGSLIAAVPTILLALIQLGPIHALFTTIVYFLSNMVFGNFVEPKVMGKGLDISPIVVLVSLVFWGWVWGPIGMILSVPLTVVIKLTMEASDDTRWIGVLLSSHSKQRD